MKKTCRILIALFTFVLFCGVSLHSDGSLPKTTEPGDVRQDEPVSELYWFYVRVKIDKKRKAYTLIGTASRIISGERKDFEKALWWGTTRGQLAVGPFLDYKEAMDARLLYRKTRRKVKSHGIEKEREVHWFLVTMKVRKRSKAYKLERMPARIASGNTEQFLDALYEGMSFERLAVGPFWDYVQAEDAKAMYRENE